MTFKLIFLILHVFSAKAIGLISKRVSKFLVEILKIIKSDLDLQMTFKS